MTFPRHCTWLPMRRDVRRFTVCWLFGFLFLLGLGCSPKSSDKDTYLSIREQDEIRAGVLVLGSPSLTAGIPGEGAISEQELVTWLDDAANHEVLKIALPTNLQDAEAEIVIPQDNPLTRAKIELGRQLFFDKRLSGLGTFSCATCHQPQQAFASYQVMPEVGRSAAPVFNRILGEEHFWDGRATSLEAQPVGPVENPFEMNSTPETSTQHIAAIPGYRLQFEKVFGAVTFENICKALASFERVLVTQAAAWDRGELSDSAMRGEILFFGDRLGCSECHSGPNFTDEAYHNLGTSRLADYGDVGRFEVTKTDADKGRFKTPSLRNVALTPPYMHNGCFGTLEEVIDFFDRGGNPGPGNTLKPLSLTDTEKQDLIEFLESLTSPLPPVETGRLPE